MRQSAFESADRGVRRFESEVVRALKIDWRSLVFLKISVHATNFGVCRFPVTTAGGWAIYTKVYR
jgi:hypothetical protein